jgi:DNA primase
MNQELNKLYDILVSILGESKRGLDERNLQLQFPCPHCIEKYGSNEERKYNLEVSLKKGVFQCWKCSSEDDEMHGSILKLIRMYGNNQLANDYKQTIKSLKESDLYKLHYTNDDFNIDTSTIENEELKLPSSYTKFEYGKQYDEKAFKYLEQRGIGWDIINEYNLGYTSFEKENKKGSFRIVIPSYDVYGELNYWVGRDYIGSDKRMKYDNPKVEKKNIIFNEEKIQWDCDVTLVEGPFDHIVVPNSIPLLGKALNLDFKLYWDIITKANANINIFLDADAYETVKETYKLLNHGRLYNKIRYVPVYGDEDPSSLYQKYGKRGIINTLASSKQIDETLL